MNPDPVSVHSSYLILLIISVVLIILSMIFSISESAFLGMNKLRLKVLKENHDKRALRVGKLLNEKEKLINTLLVSNDLVNILLSSIITAMALNLFGDKGVGLSTLVATVLLLIFGEITPKTIATKIPDDIAYLFSGFISFVVLIMNPIVVVITGISRTILKLFGIKTTKIKQSYTEEEIKTFFDLSSEKGIIEKDENRMMNLVFKFSDLEAQDIMVPRIKIKAIPVTSNYHSVIELSQRLGFSRFPVYNDSIDDIIGIIYLKDIISYKNRQSDFDVKKVMRPPLFILGTKKMSSVQQMLFENRQSMAVVVDEYSGTDGIITEKDISREIFALPGDTTLRGKVFSFDDIENQYDFEINGSVLLLDLQNALHIPLNSEINETIGGWFIEKINRMPIENDKIEFSGYHFIVKKIQSHRIERIRIVKLHEKEEE